MRRTAWNSTLPAPTEPIARKTWLKGGKPPEKKGRSRFPERRNRVYTDWICSRPCHITGKQPVDPCHVDSQGSGGYDRGNEIPMIHELHVEQHQIGWQAFEEKYSEHFPHGRKEVAKNYLRVYEKGDWAV